MEWLETVKAISSVIGLASGSLGLLTAVCKPVRKSLVAFVTRNSGRTEMQQQLTELRSMMQRHLDADAEKLEAAKNDREALLCLLRNQITEIYYAYLPRREMPAHQYKNMILLSDKYFREGGNTYVSAIVDKMRTWRVIPDSE